MALSMRNSLAKHIDFGFLKGLFRNLSELPINIDMLMEKNGYFVIAEWKKPGEHIPKGQMIALKRLAEMPRVNVLIITGNSDENECYINDIEQVTAEGKLVLVGNGLDFFRERMKGWYDRASNGKLKY
jgi:predicted ATPase